MCEAGQFKDKRVVDIFHVSAEFQLDSYADLLAELRILRKDLAHDLNIDIQDHPVEVLIFNNRWNFRNYVGQRIPEGMDRRALYVKSEDSIRVYAYRQNNLDRDLRHEATHALLHNALPFVPLWLDEGLAVYYEAKARNRVNNHHYQDRINISLKCGWNPNLADIEKLREMNDMDSGEYRQAWLWVHFMMNDSPRSRKILTDYLDEIKTGTVRGSMADRLQEAYPQLNQSVRNHALNPKVISYEKKTTAQ